MNKEYIVPRPSVMSTHLPLNEYTTYQRDLLWYGYTDAHLATLRAKNASESIYESILIAHLSLKTLLTHDFIIQLAAHKQGAKNINAAEEYGFILHSYGITPHQIALAGSFETGSDNLRLLKEYYNILSYIGFKQETILNIVGREQGGECLQLLVMHYNILLSKQFTLDILADIATQTDGKNKIEALALCSPNLLKLGFTKNNLHDLIMLDQGSEILHSLCKLKKYNPHNNITKILNTIFTNPHKPIDEKVTELNFETLSELAQVNMGSRSSTAELISIYSSGISIDEDISSVYSSGLSDEESITPAKNQTPMQVEPYSMLTIPKLSISSTTTDKFSISPKPDEASTASGDNINPTVILNKNYFSYEIQRLLSQINSSLDTYLSYQLQLKKLGFTTAQSHFILIRNDMQNIFEKLMENWHNLRKRFSHEDITWIIQTNNLFSYEYKMNELFQLLNVISKEYDLSQMLHIALSDNHELIAKTLKECDTILRLLGCTSEQIYHLVMFVPNALETIQYVVHSLEIALQLRGMIFNLIIADNAFDLQQVIHALRINKQDKPVLNFIKKLNPHLLENIDLEPYRFRK